MHRRGPHGHGQDLAEAARSLDFSKPVAVTLIAVLHMTAMSDMSERLNRLLSQPSTYRGGAALLVSFRCRERRGGA